VGKIGEAIARALVDNGYRNVVGTVRTERRKQELSHLPIPIIRDNRKAASTSEIIFLSVKPTQVAGVLKEIGELLSGKILISVAAAVSTSYIESLAPGTKVIRAMPNINIVVKSSATAISPGKNASKEDVEVARRLFETMGYVVEVDEKYQDAITAFSGSGPAYMLIFFESLLLAGLKVGLPRDVALELAVNTVTGTAKLLEKLGKHPAELRDMVITPGGVTIEAVHVMEREGFRAILMEAVERAFKKSEEISKKLNKT